MTTITVPLYITMGKVKRKNYWLNLSNSSKWQYHLSNTLKKKFKKGLTSQLNAMVSKYSQVSVTLTLYYPTQLRRDIDNSGSVLVKFFLDALVEHGVLPDDSFDHVKEIHILFGGIDKEHPRGEFKIEEI